MSHRISFPSERFPAVPSVSVALPQYWECTSVPGSLLSARRMADGEGFIPNVAVRWQRAVAQVDLQGVAKLIDGGIADLSELEDVGRWLVTSGDLRGYAREFSFRDSQAGVLAQAWRVFVIDQEEIADIIEVVGTVGTAQVDEFLEVRSILDSVDIAVSPRRERSG